MPIFHEIPVNKGLSAKNIGIVFITYKAALIQIPSSIAFLLIQMGWSFQQHLPMSLGLQMHRNLWWLKYFHALEAVEYRTKGILPDTDPLLSFFLTCGNELLLAQEQYFCICWYTFLITFVLYRQKEDALHHALQHKIEVHPFSSLDGIHLNMYSDAVSFCSLVVCFCTLNLFPVQSHMGLLALNEEMILLNLLAH